MRNGLSIQKARNNSTMALKFSGISNLGGVVFIRTATYE